MIEREPIGDTTPAVVPGETKMHVAERLHHFDHRVRRRPLRVGPCRRPMPARRTRRSRQIRHHQTEMSRQRRRHPVPHDVGLRIAVQQEERRSPPRRARRCGRRRCRSTSTRSREKGRQDRAWLDVTLPLHRPPADVAAAEAVRPADAVDRRVGARLRLARPSCPSAETLSTRPPFATMRPPSALVPAWKISTPSTAAASSSPSMTEPLA